MAAPLVQPCVRQFPANATVKDAAGLPFAAVLQPAGKLPPSSIGTPLDLPAFLDVLRCAQCFGYINCHCLFKPPSWQCSLCGHVNQISQLWKQRYTQGLEALPELRGEVFETLMDEYGPFGADERGDAGGPAPVLLALVDLSGGEEWLELVRSALLAALEALPPYTLFGLLTFTNQLGLHDTRARQPSARLIQLTDSPTQPLQLPCSEVLPLRALLAPVGQFKDGIVAALEALAPGTAQHRPSSGAGAPADHHDGNGLQHGDMNRAEAGASRAFGPALLGILEYLQAVTRAPFRPRGQAAAAGSPAAGAGAGTVSSTAAALPPAQSPVRLMTFLAGPPDWGVGQLLDRRRAAANAGRPVVGDVAGLPEDDTWLQDVSPAAAQFYEQAAVAAAALGCCCDLYAISEAAVGLEYLEPIANTTGGAMYMYPSLEDSALPQDVYRRLAGSHATAGVLRVRTTPAFTPTRHYGRLYADAKVDNLHHIVSCSESDTFAVDFELASPAGFVLPSGHVPTPVVQLAFQYTTVVPPTARARPASRSQLLLLQEEERALAVAAGTAGQQAGVGSTPSKASRVSSAAGLPGLAGGERDTAQCMLQRRLRVATYQFACAAAPLEVMRSCNVNALLPILLHKILRVVQAQGSSRARVVLRDWLANLVANYHQRLHAGAAPAALLQLPIDVSFARVEALHAVPRLVYALLRSPLLAPALDAQHPDLLAFTSHLWRSLPPQELQCAVYPALSSYADPDTLVLSRHSLSRGALLADGAPPIFLLDAYVLLVVLYTARAPAGLPFPPPQTSRLRRAIAAIRQERRITPQVRFVREGTDDAALFFHLLLDEPDSSDLAPALPIISSGLGAGDGTSAGDAGGPQQQQPVRTGLVRFLEHVRLEVLAALQSEVPLTSMASVGAPTAS